MNCPQLDCHDIIAWDMDGTLVNGPNAAFFRAYILAHPEKQHHIVTFRTGPAQQDFAVKFWHEECVYELHHHGVPHGTIRAVHSCPDDLYHAYAQSRSFYNPEKTQAFMEWKGMKAAEFGATVLVDDMAALVVEGCTKYGIAYVDAYDPCFSQQAG